MPTSTHTCLIVTCDVCKLQLQSDEESTLHFTDIAEAQTVARAFQWAALSGGEFVCNLGDDDHQQFLDALMPPEPVAQIRGQFGLDGTEAS